jgi:hypothetical protein
VREGRVVRRWLSSLGSFVRGAFGRPNVPPQTHTPYRYKPEEVAAFERTMGIELPGAYKAYLMDVGAGFMCGSRVALLDEWCEPDDPKDLPNDFLAQPFPHSESWNDITIDDATRGWDSPYFDPWLCRGSMRIQSLGCGEYLLLVVSGSERGNLWHDARAISHIAGGHGGARRGIVPKISSAGERVTIEEYLA